MSGREVLECMRDDWNRRAREDAHYYVAFGRRGQEEGEFLSTAADVVRSLEHELRRLTRGGRPLKALEIGCGPGRLMRPLSRHFTEIHGVDVSDEMVRRAREALRDIPHAHARLNDGRGLDEFAAESFDFVYSYAVFQHIPSRDVVLNYLREAWRVLKTGGYLRCQINGLPEASGRYDTWNGVRISAREVADFAGGQGFQVLALEGESTQYMWTTLRKREAGWKPSRRESLSLAQVCRVTNAYSSEPVVPARGRFACVSLWLEGLHPDCDVRFLRATVAGRPAKAFYIGPPEADGLQQLNILLPQPTRTGLVPLEVDWLGQPLIRPMHVRVVPCAAIPRLISVSDAVDLLSTRVVSGTVKVVLEDMDEPKGLRAFIDERPVDKIEFFCVDPLPPCFEVNLTLPAGIGPGFHHVRLEIGARRMAPVPIEVRAP